MLYPVWSLRGRIGEIHWERRGLYWDYRAKLHEAADGFIRLYLHVGENCIRLGLFGGSGDLSALSGRVSIRSVGRMDEIFTFSISSAPYLPPEALPEKPPLPFPARNIDGVWEYCVPPELVTEEMIPFFCFFRPAVIDNGSCVLLTQDPEGKPFLPFNP